MLNMTFYNRLKLCWLVIAALTACATVEAAEEVSFNRDIRPLLSKRCFACHGPDENSREAGLRLDEPDGDEGAIGFAIEPGSIEDSEMWDRITSDDEDLIMPPPDSHLEPFDEKELELVKRWIESGAEYESFWAFQAIAPPIKPEVENGSWSQQPIDGYVLRALESIGNSPSAQADPRTLIRRVTFDLIGLPPTREETNRFVESFNQDPDAAWERLVDRLLDRPQYGEHIGRYWLDLVRFADSNGMHKDFHRDHVAYRDWVIRAFNRNLPYDDFVRHQLAGDLYPDPTTDQLIASGFHRLHLIIDRGTALPEESFIKNVVDRTTAVGTAFLGLTVQCAQCHDHKFDPISQKDFYSLTAFFNNLDAKPETVSKQGPERGFQPPFILLGSAGQKRQFRSLKRELARIKKEVARVEQEIADAQPSEFEEDPKDESSDRKDASAEPVGEPINAVDETAEVVDEPTGDGSAEVDLLASNMALLESLNAELEQRQQAFDHVDGQIARAMVMRERKEVRPTFVLERGLYDSPGEEVTRNTPQFLPSMQTAGDVPTRMDLANWFVAPEHPLTARVAVNRIWQQFFGCGLVKTSEDFGNQGEVPSHPALLDYLAFTFVDSGWDVKALVKQIVMSRTYRQASESRPERFNEDSDNKMLSRGPRYRLDAEMIRDQILATSGLLSEQMYGPSVKPPQPDGLWKSVSMIGETYEPDTGEAARRRSVYTFWKRSMPPPQMTILNAPLRDSCIARRERTNTPTQALLLLNEPEYFKAAAHLANIVLQQPDSERLDFVWETVTSQLPDEQEKAVLQKLLDDLIEQYNGDPNKAEHVCQQIEWADENPSEQRKTTVASWTVLCSVLYNLDITKTKN